MYRSSLTCCRRLLHSHLTPVDATVDLDHSSLLHAIVAADSSTAINLVIDATFVSHRPRRNRTGWVFRRPLRPDAQLDDQQRDRPVLAIRMVFPRISQACLQGVRYARISYRVDHGDYRCCRPTNDLVGAKVGSYLKVVCSFHAHRTMLRLTLQQHLATLQLAASTASTTTTPAATSTTLATLALAAAALPTRSRSSPVLLNTKDVNSSSRSVGGGKGGGGTPLKEGWARSATSSTYSDYASLSCKEVLLEQVDSEVCGVKCEKVVPDYAKRVREAGDYEVESDVHRGHVLV
ncbi:unnamed protein product [Closterium sp. NIES-53]